MKRIALRGSFFLILGVFSCAKSTNAFPAEPSPPLSQALKKIQQTLDSRYSLTMSAFGEAGSIDKLQKINIGFHGSYCIEKDEARKLILSCVKDVLEIVNSNRNLVAELEEGGVSEKNLMLYLLLFEQPYSSAKEPCVAGVSANEGMIQYYYESKEQPLGYSRIDEEPFEEAVAILGKKNDVDG